MWFRIALILAAVILWAISIWLSTHTSENPTVFDRYSFSYIVILLAVYSLAIATSLFSFGKLYSYIFEKRHNLVVLLISSVVALGVLEFAIRMIDPIGISYYEETKRYHLDKVADSELYYRHKIHLDTTYQGVAVKTNEIGLRDNSISEKKEDEFRILFLGDSVTFGWGVESEDVYVTKTGHFLQKNSQKRVRTINSGVGSYNTDNEYSFIERHGDSLKPDLVVLLYVSNDIEPTPETEFNPWSEYSFDRKSPPQIVQLMLGRSWVYRIVMHLKNYGIEKSDGRLDVNSIGWKQSMNSLVLIHQYCKKRNIPFVLFYYRMLPQAFENEVSDQIATISKRTGFLFEDVLPWFKGRDIQTMINSLVDPHPNALGHKLIAENMASSLEKKVLYKLLDKQD